MIKRHFKTLLCSAAAAVLVLLGAGGIAVAGTLPAAKPYLILSAYYGHAGDTVTVRGYGFGHDEAVDIKAPAQTVSGYSDSSGNFSQQLTLGNIKAGKYDITATDRTDRATAKAGYTLGSYYGTAKPSAYYVLPPQSLSIEGSSYAPNEPISVVDATTGQSETGVKADANGHFITPSRPVPYSQANSKQTFVVTGQTSGATSTFTITVGTYYPDITPANYYVDKGSNVVISGKNFAPFEGIRLFVNGRLAGRAVADSNGSLQNISVKAPTTGSSFVLTARGMEIGESASRIINLHP